MCLVFSGQVHFNVLSTSDGVIWRDSCSGLCDTLLHFRAPRGIGFISDPFSYSLILSLVQNISQSCVTPTCRTLITVMDFITGRNHGVINTSNSSLWEKWESIIISMCVKHFVVHQVSEKSASLAGSRQYSSVCLTIQKVHKFRLSKKKEQINPHQACSLLRHANTPWGTI